MAATLIKRRKIGGRWYDLHLDRGDDPDWPWFVNAYTADSKGTGFRTPARFCAGKTEDDAIERVTRGLLKT